MKASILLFLLVLNSFGVKAQQYKGQSPEYRAEQKVSMLNYSLNLTHQQAEKVSQVYVNHYKFTDSLRAANLKPEPNSKVKTGGALMALFIKAQHETDKKISSILNNDQKVAYTKLVNSREILVIATPVAPK